MNFPILLLAALVPMVIGFVWYNPNVFGKAWMQAAQMTEEKMKGGNMALIFVISFILSVLLAVQMNQVTIHQAHLDSLFVGLPGFGDPAHENSIYFADFMERYGAVNRSFGHGAFHGVLAGFFFALPILGINALFERKGFKYIAMNSGYWIVTLAIMGGIICNWA